MLLRNALLLFVASTATTVAFQLKQNTNLHRAAATSAALTPICTTTTAPAIVSATARPALVYLPNGEVVDDTLLDSENNDALNYQPSSLVDYLNNNPDDFRGALAVLAAANSDVDIMSMVAITAVGVNTKHLKLDVLSSREDGTCVQIAVQVTFPDSVPSETDNQRLEALKILYPRAQAVLEAKRKEKEGYYTTEQQQQQQQQSSTDLGVPYDAAASLAYEFSDKSMPYKEFKAIYEAKAVANVIAKQFGKTHEETTPNTTTLDVGVPYDAAARVAYEESDKSLSYEEFRVKYETDAVTDVIAKRRREDTDIQNKDQDKKKIVTSKSKKDGESDRKELEAKKKQEMKQRQLLIARLSVQQAQWEKQKAIRDARRQPKSAEEETKLAEKYAAFQSISERAFAILVDLYMIEPR